jgi:hypothetical protein
LNPANFARPLSAKKKFCKENEWSQKTTRHPNMINPQETPKIIPPHGGYRELQSYQMSEIVYDETVVFCDRFISPRSRAHDQIVQAAARMAIGFHGGQAGNGIWSSRFPEQGRHGLLEFSALFVRILSQKTRKSCDFVALFVAFFCLWLCRVRLNGCNFSAACGEVRVLLVNALQKKLCGFVALCETFLAVAMPPETIDSVEEP